VIHVRHESEEPDGLFKRGTEAFDFKPQARPRDGEPVITKNVNSAFIGTDLEERLRRDGITSCAIVGLTTDHCCSTTTRMAANLGFETWLLQDAMATFDRTAPDGDVIPAAAVHKTELASLNDEFAEVLDTGVAIARLREAAFTPP
jgi:nicotinamidase-related amidase